MPSRTLGFFIDTFMPFGPFQRANGTLTFGVCCTFPVTLQSFEVD